MREQHETERERRRNERVEKDAQNRLKRAFREDEALDAAVRQSIDLHGA